MRALEGVFAGPGCYGTRQKRELTSRPCQGFSPEFRFVFFEVAERANLRDGQAAESAQNHNSLCVVSAAFRAVIGAIRRSRLCPFESVGARIELFAAGRSEVPLGPEPTT
jgi:hypothetical protein